MSYLVENNAGTWLGVWPGTDEVMALEAARESLGMHANGLRARPAPAEGGVTDRRGYIGGSDAARILGVAPEGWGDAVKVYEEKIGEPDETAVPDSWPMRRGRLLEGPVAEEYAERTGRTLRAPKKLARHKRYPWIAVHLDRRVVGEPKRIVEIKTASSWEGWGTEAEGGPVPSHYLVQCQHAMLAAGAEVCDLVVMGPGYGIRVYEIKRSGKLLAVLEEREVAFWRQNVALGVMPEPTTQDGCKRAWVEAEPGQTVEASPEMMGIVADLMAARVALDAAKARRDSLEVRVKNFMGAANAEALVDASGNKLISWTCGVRETLSIKRIRAEYPEVAEAVAETIPARRMSVTKHARALLQ